MKIRLMTAAVASAALVFSACGGDDGDATSSTTAPSVAAATAPNAADVTFAQGMIAHHQQAVEMAEIALDPTRAAGPAVTELARRIQAAQEPEIATMTAWLAAWDEPVAMDTSGGHDMSSMEGMMTAAEMDALAKATGPAFDNMWLGMMIAHHQGAVAQSETVTTDGAHSDVRILADQIIAAQTAEITEMQDLLAG